MCFVALAVNAHPDLPLIICANRDEFYARPTARAHFWADHPIILGGRDQRHSGTWLAIDRAGRFAAVTNIRGVAHSPSAPSRGGLIQSYLSSEHDAERFARTVTKTIDDYNGVNLLVGDRSSIWYLSSLAPKPVAVSNGVHGLSNASLNTPWPKVIVGRRGLSALIASAKAPEIESLLDLLTDRAPPDDTALPDTGVGMERERLLAPVYIDGHRHDSNYGTRSSTVVTRSTDNEVRYLEVTWHDGDDATPRGQSIEFQFRLATR